jgi:DNA-directed RNA polymerase specialized sigma24 family protein
MAFSIIGRVRAEMAPRKSSDAKSQTSETEVELSHVALDRVALILAVLAIRLGPVRNGTNKQKAVFLKSLGFDYKEIASILNSSPATVAVDLSRSKKPSAKSNSGKTQSSTK